MSAQKTTPSSDGCPKDKLASIQFASAVISSKWMPELVLALSYGVHRFSELRTQSGGVNPRTLSARLDELETCGIVTKKAYAETPPRIEYTLTDKGQDLVPILERMIEWGSKYNRSQATGR